MFTPFDLSIVQMLAAHRAYGLSFAFIGVSEFASAITIAGLTLALAVYLAYRGWFALAQGIIVTIATAALGVELVKLLVHRMRPPQALWAYHETGYSFPSAHATLAIAFYGFLIFMVVRSSLTRAWRIICEIILGLLIIAIGFSRLYLGVHYPTDVLGGYVLGALCLWLGIWATKTLERRSGSV